MFTILFIDDHKLLIPGMKSAIESLGAYTVTGISDSQKVMYFLNNRNVPDLIITDLNMPGMDGIELIQKIRSVLPKQKIAVMTMYYTFNLMKTLESLGVSGFILKNDEMDVLNQLIITVINGGKFISPSLHNLTKNLNYDFSQDGEVVDNFIKKFSLSPRELEILRMVVSNMSSQQIADKLFISKDTVSTHRKNIIRKTKCSTVIDLVNLAKSFFIQPISEFNSN